jgi:hypothetical protein
MKTYKVYILYVGDAWLSRSSLTNMGVFSSRLNAIKAFVENAGIEDKNTIAKMAESLKMQGQTQGGEENWMICEYELEVFRKNEFIA